MKQCENLYLLSTVACQLSACLDDEDVAILSADLVVLSDMLASILARNAKNDGSASKEEGEDCL